MYGKGDRVCGSVVCMCEQVQIMGRYVVVVGHQNKLRSSPSFAPNIPDALAVAQFAINSIQISGEVKELILLKVLEISSFYEIAIKASSQRTELCQAKLSFMKLYAASPAPLRRPISKLGKARPTLQLNT
uniref:Uncharacterized protein n=1 Tax=Glossina brevipalpis TaxID=37001 RepID=A0A1A9WV19_9MUSC